MNRLPEAVSDWSRPPKRQENSGTTGHSKSLRRTLKGTRTTEGSLTADQRLDRLSAESRGRIPRGGAPLVGGNLIGFPVDESPISPLMALTLRVTLQSPPREMLRATSIQPENLPSIDITNDENGRNAADQGGNDVEANMLNQEVVLLIQRQLTDIRI